MKGIITVLGRDRVGIMARVCTFLAGERINILDISQTILHGLFNMVMVVDLTGMARSFDDTADGLSAIGTDMDLQIKLQREDIFNAMQRI